MSTKISVIGAGNVGAACAKVLVTHNATAEVVLLDIKKGLSEGKAMDIMQTVTLQKSNVRLKGVTDDYASIAGSKVVVITSGVARKPGMSREDLVGVNAGIVQSVVEKILLYAPDAVLLLVTNPVDSMCYMTLKISGLPRNKVLAVGCALDSARFKYYLSEAMNVNPTDLEATVIGGHGDTTMIPLTSLATYTSVPVTSLLSKEKLDEVVAATKIGGSILTGLLGTSAWFAPGAAAGITAEAIVKDQKLILPCGVMLEGEYGQSDVVIGVPVVLGSDGWEKIVDFPISEEEKDAFVASANSIRKVNQILVDTGMIP